jgi:hypothetical protein
MFPKMSCKPLEMLNILFQLKRVIDPTQACANADITQKASPFGLAIFSLPLSCGRHKDGCLVFRSKQPSTYSFFGVTAFKSFHKTISTIYFQNT